MTLYKKGCATTAWKIGFDPYLWPLGHMWKRLSLTLVKDSTFIKGLWQKASEMWLGLKSKAIFDSIKFVIGLTHVKSLSKAMLTSDLFIPLTSLSKIVVHICPTSDLFQKCSSQFFVPCTVYCFYNYCFSTKSFTGITFSWFT